MHILQKIIYALKLISCCLILIVDINVPRRKVPDFYNREKCKPKIFKMLSIIMEKIVFHFQRVTFKKS